MAEGQEREALGGAEFLPEAEDLLESLGRGLQQAEAELRAGGIRAPRVNELFRGVHSLKGLAGMFGRAGLAELSHALEDFLDRLRMGRTIFDAAALDTLFEAHEIVERLVAQDARPPEEMLARLSADEAAPAAGARPDSAAGLPEELARSLTTYEEHRLRQSLAAGTPLWLVDLSLPLTTFDETLRDVCDALNRQGEVISTLPRYSPGDETRLAFRLLVASREPAEALQRQVGGEAGLQRLALGSMPSAAAGRGQAGERETDGAVDRSTVRVGLDRLDRLLDAVGDLLVFRHDVEGIARSLQEVEGARKLGERLQLATRDLDKRLQELQRSVIGARMVPVSQIAGRLARLVRKLARAAGKEADLRMQGGATELDKMVIDRLQSPLMHLVRNALHHGIESAEERAAAGKPARGSLLLSAAQRGNTVVLALSDDGRGVALDEVKRAAVSRGLLDKDAELGWARACDLIFEPGFSSAREVGEVSGRGVGLDVVRRELQALGGSVRLETRPGQGVRVEIVLPITLAIMPCMVVRSGGQEFAMPVAAIAETLRFQPERIVSVARRPILRLRGESLPYTDLKSLFRLAGRDHDPGYVVVTRQGEGRMAMGVDELLGQHEVVIKPVGRHLDRLPGVAGATELGEGRAALVLDLPSLVNVAWTAPVEAA